MQQWDRLRVFDAVAEHGSVRAAAEALYVSGPAVSQQLRKLEREVGTALVEPSGRGIRLTAAGAVLARHARAVRQVVRRADDELSELTGEIGGRLRIGGVMSAIRTLLGPAVAELVAHHPRVEPVIVDGEAPEFVEMLAGRRLDAAIVESWASNSFPRLSSLRAEPLLDEPVDLAVPAGLVPRPRSIVEAADQPWVVCPAGSGPYTTVVDVLRHAGLDPDIRYEISSYTGQLDLVASGLAVALVPRLARATADPRGVDFVTLDAPLRRRLHLVTREGDDRPVVAELAAALRRRRDLVGRPDDRADGGADEGARTGPVSLRQ
jgi:DNA-binding transcriptional LysR family regulator